MSRLGGQNTGPPSDSDGAQQFLYCLAPVAPGAGAEAAAEADPEPLPRAAGLILNIFARVLHARLLVL